MKNYSDRLQYDRKGLKSENHLGLYIRLDKYDGSEQNDMRALSIWTACREMSDNKLVLVVHASQISTSELLTSATENVVMACAAATWFYRTTAPRKQYNILWGDKSFELVLP